jgi:ligand-binding SRPBCC domain-containing protein
VTKASDARDFDVETRGSCSIRRDPRFPWTSGTPVLSLEVEPREERTMPVVDDSIVIERPRQEVWEFATDPDNIMLTNSNLVEFDKLTDGPVGEGTRFRGVVKVAGKKLEWTSEVTKFDAPSTFAQQSIESAIPFTVEVTYEDADGGTRMSWHQESESFGGVFGKLSDPIVTRMYAKDVRANLESTKEILEADAG